MELARESVSEETKHFQMPLILAVEDNEDNLLLMNYALDSFGCRVISQQDGSAVLLIAKEYQPNLILLDVLMPNQSGIDIVKFLKQDPDTYHIPVIAVTALAGEEQRARLIASGFDDYICKPYTLEDLETMIHSYVCENLDIYNTLGFCQE
jgi:CheY-like chemotaxis protein